MEIRKAKITKDNTLTATYMDETGAVTVEGKNLVTKDLVRAFSSLISHMAFLCELKEADGKESLDELPGEICDIIEVTGFTKGGDGDSAGVTLTGKRFLKTNKVLNLNAPFTKLVDDTEDYNFQFELEQAIEECCYEVNEYLFNKKWAVVQQELPFAEETEITADVIEDAPVETSTDAEVFEKIMNDSSLKLQKGNRKTKIAS